MRPEGSGGSLWQRFVDWFIPRWRLFHRVGIGGVFVLIVVGLALAVLVAYEFTLIWKILNDRPSLDAFLDYVPILEATAIAGLTFGLGLLHAEELVQGMEEE